METIQLYLPNLAKIFWLTALSFIIAIIWTPLFTDFLYRNRLGKRIRKTGYDESRAPIFYRLHKDKADTPTMGGLLIWLTVAVITLLFNLSRSGHGCLYSLWWRLVLLGRSMISLIFGVLVPLGAACVFALNF